MKLLSIKKSDKPEKKYVATFCMCPGETKCPMNERKKVHFGAMKDGKPMDDYTRTKDKEQRERYRKRHAKEKDQDADTPGALAYWILWGDSTSIRENIKSFKEKYNV
jgi:hypothetical protein